MTRAFALTFLSSKRRCSTWDGGKDETSSLTSGRATITLNVSPLRQKNWCALGPTSFLLVRPTHSMGCAKRPAASPSSLFEFLTQLAKGSCEVSLDHLET